MRSPSLRTVRAVLPHTALRSVGSYGVDETHMGIIQAREPMIRKEGVRPPLITHRVPFASSHCVCHQCRHHAICPHRAMSPLVNPRRLASRGSRKRHCDWDVLSTRGRRLTCRRLSHCTSTFLLPFAPPRCVARLPSYYESSDFCRAASSDVTGLASFVPLRRARPHREAWAIDPAASPTATGHDTSSTSFTRQISLLTSFDPCLSGCYPHT